MQFRVERIACGQPLDLARSGPSWSSLVAVSAAAMRSATARKSLWEKPRAASAGVPIRRPEVIIGDEGRRVPRCG